MTSMNQVAGLTATCAACGFRNHPQAASCTFCRAPIAAAPTNAPRRTVLLRPGAPAIELERTKNYSFGRLPSCAVMIASPNVSRLHAEITWRNGRAILIDHSSYGTLVDGMPVKEHHLVPGDEIQIGPFHCKYAEEVAVATPDEVKQATSAPGSGAMFVGRISEGGLFEYLQALEFNAKTGTLHVYEVGKGKNAWLAVRAGVPLAAEADGQVDDEAVLALLRLKRGRFVFSREVSVNGRRIVKTLTALLFEGGRRADEARRRPY